MVRIPWNAHPLQHLTLQVLNQDGEEVGELRYGQLFSPVGEDLILQLQPGETYSHTVHLLGTVPRLKWKDGPYTIRGCYCLEGYVAYAEPFQIIITEDVAR